MKKKQAYHALLLFIMSAALLACAWWSLHDSRALILRDQPLLQLSEQQQDTIRRLHGNITIEAYVRNNPQLRRGFTDLVAPFKLLQPRLHLEFVNPDNDPLRVQEHDITREGQLYISDGTYGERIDIASPQSIASALLNLGETIDIQVLHLQGHGERAYRQDSVGNWRASYERISNAKTSIGDQDQTRTVDIPRSVNLLVIADPENIPQDHNSALQTYIARGGNLLYTTDTRHPYLPSWLAKLSGLRLVEGSVVDQSAKTYGLKDPQMLVIETLGDDPITKSLRQAPLIPTAVALEDNPETPPTSDWKRNVLLWSSNQSWAERSPDADMIVPDANENKGPLALGWVLERDYQGKKQRIIILGDSDLFQDNYLNIGGNSMLVQNLFAGLMPLKAHGNIAPPELKDQYINLPEAEKLPLALTFIFIFPLLPLLIGPLFAWQRKRKYG
ncbi:MAG: Gldg family protein [Cardiobacteriaceae bacterium]|nr:Gldg family protein [Cardiobacteriaceae bacterium]